jgi:hypothetical protein
MVRAGEEVDFSQTLLVDSQESTPTSLDPKALCTQIIADEHLSASKVLRTRLNVGKSISRKLFSRILKRVLLYHWILTCFVLRSLPMKVSQFPGRPLSRVS